MHDAARPFAPPDLFTAVVGAVVDGADGAIPVVPMTDTVKRLVGARVVGTLTARGARVGPDAAGVPLAALRTAHERAMAAGERVTDDAALLERVGRSSPIAGDPMNFKITTMMDLARAEERMGGLRA